MATARFTKKKQIPMSEFLESFRLALANTPWYEYVAVVAGIASVWFSRIENVLVYPVGLINTIIYIYLSIEGQLLGEASVNLYYTIMSIIGWLAWVRKDNQQQPVLHVTRSNMREWMMQIGFFLGWYLLIFLSLRYLKEGFFPGAVPWADAFASATAFTGMWLMTKKKMESWFWWIATDMASVPLYYSKAYVVTAGYYTILLVMACFGLAEWHRRSKKTAA
jgi:nicotinamide mononucleotide transporter